MESLLQRIVETGSGIAIIDITGVPTVDTLVAQHLLKTVAAARLMGADCIISGIRPQIAQTIVHLGVDLQTVVTKATWPTRSRVALHRTGQTASARIPQEADRSAPWTAIPILKLGDCLLVTIQVDMHDRLALALQDDLTDRIVADPRPRRADRHLLPRDRGLVHRPDAGQHRRHVARCSTPRPSSSGMRPAVAITLVELGLSLPGVQTALDVDEGHGAARGAAANAGRTGAGRWRSARTETLAISAVQRRRRRAPGGARTWAAALGFSLVDQTKIVTAASELARNIVDYGGGGDRPARGRSSDGARRGLRLVFEDQGPGIPDVETALKDGYTTGGGLGLGLGGARRLSNEFEIVSRVGEGTRVTITRWK